LSGTIIPRIHIFPVIPGMDSVLNYSMHHNLVVPKNQYTWRSPYFVLHMGSNILILFAQAPDILNGNKNKKIIQVLHRE
jgi:hypothetical protein